MFLKKFKSDGIAHLSYMVGDKGVAAVIDPRRDIEVYLDLAASETVNITHIFETHRNEDYVIGSIALSNATGAQIYHGAALDFKYGNPASQGEEFVLGELNLQILETPGHTLESMSIAIFDKSFGDKAVGIFTGDALFIGDVGRTDFYPDMPEKVAGMLYDSIFKKILPLGDQAILYPAHGAGSVCGGGLAAREFSTLGYERLFNPVLQKTNREEFIRYKVNEKHTKPPYFKKMEEYNQNGAPQNCLATTLPVLSVEEFEQAQSDGAQIVDTRTPEAILGAFIPGSFGISLNMLPAYAGWLLEYDKPIALIVNPQSQLQTAITHLYRLGFDNIIGYLEDGLRGWEIKAKRYDSIPAIHICDVLKKIKNKEDFTLLDVRDQTEYKEGSLPGAKNIYIGHLPNHLNELDKAKKTITLCGSGRRAMVAATILKAGGFEDVEVCMGSMDAYSEIE